MDNFNYAKAFKALMEFLDKVKAYVAQGNAKVDLVRKCADFIKHHFEVLGC